MNLCQMGPSDNTWVTTIFPFPFKQTVNGTIATQSSYTQRIHLKVFKIHSYTSKEALVSTRTILFLKNIWLHTEKKDTLLPLTRVEWNKTARCKNTESDSPTDVGFCKVGWGTGTKKYPDKTTFNIVKNHKIVASNQYLSGISLFWLVDHSSPASPPLPPLLHCFSNGWQEITSVMDNTAVRLKNWKSCQNHL